MYKLIDFPKKGELTGHFLSLSPGRAAQKVINKLNVSDEGELNMTKFWIREYIPLSDKLKNLLKYIDYKLEMYKRKRIKLIFSLLYYNLLKRISILKKNNKLNIKNFDMFNELLTNKHNLILKKLNNKQIKMLLSILLTEYYMKNRNKRTNIKNNLDNYIFDNNNHNSDRNINNIIIKYRKDVKLPNIFIDSLSKYFINNTEFNYKHINDEIVLNLRKNLNKLL